MNEINLDRVLTNLDDARGNVEQLEAGLKDYKSQVRDLEDLAVKMSVEERTKKIIQADRTISFKTERKVKIMGGDLKDTAQRQFLLKFLEKKGYGKDIVTMRMMHGTKLNKAISEINFKDREMLIDKKIISVFNQPVVKITKKKVKL